MHIRDLILALLIVAVWGFNFVVIKIGLQDVSPLTLCSIRFFLTAIPIVFFLKRPTVPWRALLVYGFVMFALQFGCLFVGMHFGVTSGLAALITQIQVFFTLMLAALFLNEKPHASQIMGTIIAFSGIAYVGMKLEGDVSLVGFLFIVAAGASWSIGNLIAKKMDSTNMFSLVIWGNLIAFPPIFLSAVLLEGKESMLASLSRINNVTLIAIFYIVYFSTIFGYGTWSWLIKRYPIASIAPYALLVPILGFLSSAIVLHEPLQSWKLVAGALVVIGLCINLFGMRIGRKKQEILEESD